MGYQEGAGMTVSKKLDCMVSKLDGDSINARLTNAYYYGNNGGYYEPTQ
jgi:hypothetical protein